MSFLKRLWGSDYEEKLLEALVEKGLITLERAQELLMEVRNTGRRAADCAGRCLTCCPCC